MRIASKMVVALAISVLSISACSLDETLEIKHKKSLGFSSKARILVLLPRVLSAEKEKGRSGNGNETERIAVLFE